MAKEICPHHPILDTNRGLSVREIEGAASAKLLLKKANSLNQAFAQPLRILGRLSKEAGAYKEALGYAQQCLMIKPRCRESRILMADFLETLGNLSEARSHREYAKQLPVLPALFDHLISPEIAPPWTLYLNGEDETVLRRFKNLQNFGKC